jgi:hypothetical protein
MNHTNPTKDRDELGCSGVVGSSCFTRDICRVIFTTGRAYDYNKRNMPVVMCDTDVL